MGQFDEKAIVTALCRYPVKGGAAVRGQTLILEEGKGIAGDCHANGGGRQISVLTADVRAWMEKQETPGFCFHKYRENLLLEGIALSKLQPGLLLCTAGGIELELSGFSKGCHRELCRLAQEGYPCMLAGNAVFAKVRKGGLLHCGDVLEIHKGQNP